MQQLFHLASWEKETDKTMWKGSKGKEKLFTYDRDIICLPMSHAEGLSAIKIPKCCIDLAKNGLIGKIRLTSMMTARIYKGLFAFLGTTALFCINFKSVCIWVS